VSAQEEFARIQLQFVDPTQREHEIIRPIVLFGETAAERSRQTGVERTVVGDKAHRFVLGGMAALQDEVCAEFVQKITGSTGEVSGNRFFQSFRTYYQSDSVFRA
jgi:hypothetical protein